MQLFLVLIQIIKKTFHCAIGVCNSSLNCSLTIKPVFLLISSAWDRRIGTQVAIKKLHRPFQTKLFAKRAYRELRLLKHMKHENVRRGNSK